MQPIAMLTVSNPFRTFAWHGHLKVIHYYHAWQEFTTIARAIKNEEQWRHLHKALRTTYGSLGKRALRSVVRPERYPMLPDGRFAIVQFDTSFAHKQAAIETVVLALGQDGAWRIHDYIIN
jgi:hypothetical protein